MIFVTVGTQGAFDRLVHAVDAWAARHPEHEVFAQIGPSDAPPQHCAYSQDLEPSEFRARLESASHVIAHAGCGTILTALELGKPVVVMPRRAALGEHRNDHQVATAQRFVELDRVHAAFDEAALLRALDQLATLSPAERISAGASRELIETVREFLAQD